MTEDLAAAAPVVTSGSGAPSESPRQQGGAVRLLVTGAGGQLGSDLVALSRPGLEVIGLTSADLDITDPDAVRTAVAKFAAGASDARSVVVNAAAYTAVDAAETDVDRAFAVNEAGPRALAGAAAAEGIGFVHVSTDYVFPGDGTEPYPVSAPTGPKSVYGASKLAGEEAVRAAHPDAHVVRTAWVYGITGKNFVRTMARLEAAHPQITVVDDQRGSPTWSADLAAGLVELAAGDLPGGTLHATNSGDTTWCGFAKAIFAELGADPDRVRPITSAEYPVPAPRPSYSVLSGQEWAAAGLTALQPWPDALRAAFVAANGAFRP